MALDVTGREKPFYEEGALVEFNLDGNTGPLRGTAKIRGRAMEHIIDIWIIEVVEVTAGTIDKDTYPWSCLTIPHSLLKRVRDQ
jgi:hypothetical protein